MFKKISGNSFPQLSPRFFLLLGSIFILLQTMRPITARAQQAVFHIGTISSYQTTGFVQSAYPDIDRLPSGRLVCVFSCNDTTKPSKWKIAVCVSDDNGLTWSKPEIIFNHPNAIDGDPNLLVDGKRIFAFSTTVPHLRHRIDSTTIFFRISYDGVNWSEEKQLKKSHRYVCGKIHRGYRLKDGTLILGYSWDTWTDQHMFPATEGEMNLKSGVLRSRDGGKTWKPGGNIYADVKKTSPSATNGLAEPAYAMLADGSILALLRAGGDKLYETWSSNGGLSWEVPRLSHLTAHNSPAALWRLDNSPEILVAWDDSPTGRDPLAVALSSNGGKTWSNPRVIVNTGGPQASYPSVIQAKDGTMIVVWQQDLDKGSMWRQDMGKEREIRIARFNRAWLLKN